MSRHKPELKSADFNFLVAKARAQEVFFDHLWAVIKSELVHKSAYAINILKMRMASLTKQMTEYSLYQTLHPLAQKGCVNVCV